MTLAPIDSHNFTILDGPRYELGEMCCNPTCNRRADHTHHLFRRKRGHPSHWVQLPDGEIVGNEVPICARCHDLVTGRLGGHKSVIRWYEGNFVWCSVISPEMGGSLIYEYIAPLSWQPPHGMTEELRSIKHDICPTCGHAEKPPRPKQPARKRKTWTVQVPADQEDGAQVLDDYVDAIVPIFNLDPNGGAMTRYHALTRSLAFVLVNRDSIPEEAKAQ